MRWILQYTMVLFLTQFQVSHVFAQNPPVDHRQLELMEEHKCHSEISVLDTQSDFPVLEPKHRTNTDQHKMMCPYDLDGYAGLTEAALVSYLLSTNEYDCVGAVLFQYDATNSPAIFTDAKLQAVLDTLTSLAPSFDGTSAAPIHSLVTYARIYLFHEFYESSITIDATSLDKLLEATNALTANAHLLDLNDYTAGMMSDFLVLLDQPGLRHLPGTIGLLKQIMLDWTVNDTWVGVSDINWISDRWSIAFLMFRGIVNNDADYILAIENDPAFIQLMNDVAIDVEMRAQSSLEFICDNFIAEVARLASVPALNNIACGYIGSDLPLFPRLDPNWLSLSTAMNEYCDCMVYDACENPDSVAVELDEFLFPNTYIYNDGELVMKAAFDQDVADELYYASRQVESQFFRMLQGSEPVTGDTNDALSCIIFNSKTVYDEYAPYLYNIPTNNGGIYIESRAEFYTWDRPSTYSLSLEELFRHEFSHYLQGRYWIPDLWGVNPLYDNGRMVWIEEGSAELFTGSTASQGINLITNAANRINSDAPNWPSVSDIVNSNYNTAGAIYYPYGNLLWYFIYTNEYQLFKEILDLLQTSNVSGFDALMNNLKNDAVLAADFQAFLGDVQSGTILSWEPNTDWLPHENFSLGDPTEILQKYAELTGDNSGSVETIFANSIQRFKITSEISGTLPAANNAEAAAQISTTLDSISQVLGADLWVNNFDYLDMYFKNLDFQGAVPTATMNIRGSLKDALTPDVGQADFSANTTYILAGDTVLLLNQSTGYYDSLLWSYPGGELVDSISPQEIYIRYNTAGDYLVGLNIFNGNTSLDEKIESDYIHVYEASSQNFCTPVHSNPGTREITRVVAGGVDNITGEGVMGYSDYTNMLMTMTRGQNNSILVEVPSSLFVSFASNHLGVWLDYNDDGVFDNTTEKVVEMISNETISDLRYYDTNIAIPTDATSDVIRMRVRHAWIDTDDFIDPCAAEGEGETEDYSVVFLDATPSPVTLNLAAVLEGPFDTSSGLMHDVLRAQNQLPLEQPYTMLGYAVPNATTTNTLLDVMGSTAIVDWIIVELRDAVDPSILVESQACLIQRDGTIVSADGGPVVFEIVNSEVFVVLRHRNHFGVRTNQTYNTSEIISVDFSDLSTDVYGTNSMNELSNTHVLISGDANADGQVNSIDNNLNWRLQNGQTYQYLNFGADFNLDGIVNSVDKNLYWRHNNSKVEQID